MKSIENDIRAIVKDELKFQLSHDYRQLYYSAALDCWISDPKIEQDALREIKRAREAVERREQE